MTGAQNIVSTVGRLRTIMTTVRLDISEPQVEVAGKTASVRTTAQLILRDRDGADVVEARDVLVEVEKRDAGWVVTTARVRRVIPP
jgi:hypothetical protein